MKTIYAIIDNETEEVVLLAETIDDAQETVLSLQEEAMYERFLSNSPALILPLSRKSGGLRLPI